MLALSAQALADLALAVQALAALASAEHIGVVLAPWWPPGR